MCRWILFIATCAAQAGCAGARPALQPEAAIAEATGVSSGVTFRVEGGPLNEPFETTDALPLSEATRRAVTTDPSIQAALARVRMALADADQARLWPNPVLNVALRWPTSGGSPIVEASLAQDLIAILTVPRKANAADNRLRQAAADALTVGLDSATEVQERYSSVQALDRLVPVLEERRALVYKLVDIAKARLDAGEGTREDLTVLQAQRVELEVVIAATEQEQRDERLRLARLMGEPLSPAAWTLDGWTPPALTAFSEAAWVDAALRRRPEIQSVEWRLAALGDDLALARWFPFQGASAGARAEDDNGWSVGPEVSVPLPVFDLGQARSARVTAEQIEARHELTRAGRAVVEDVRRAHESLVRSASNLRRVRDELIPLQQERRFLAEAAFRAGHSDATSLFLAEQDLRAAEARAIDLERQTTLALVRMQRAVGGAGAAEGVAAGLVANFEEDR